ENTQIALGAWNLDLVDLFVHERSIGRHDLELQVRGKGHLRSLPLARLLDGFFDRADEIEVLLRNLVMLTGDDFLEAADRIRNRDVLSFQAGELLRHEERLRQKLLDLPRA